jgi:DNA-directed RNA polymerase specialized sigma24 family protein
MMKYKPEDIYFKALEGDEEAWGIIRSWIFDILKKLKSRVKGEEPEDLVNMIILALLEKIEKGTLKLRRPSAFYSYLFMFSRDRIIDYVRTREFTTRIQTNFPADSKNEENDLTDIEHIDLSADQERRLIPKEELEVSLEHGKIVDEEDRKLFNLVALEEAGLSGPDDEKELESINNLPVKKTRLKKKIIVSMKE